MRSSRSSEAGGRAPPEFALPVWLQHAGDAWMLSLAVQPGAPRTATAGDFDGCLKLKVHAPPIEGRANEAIIDWAARQLGLPRSALALVAGERSRRKRLRIQCALDAKTIVERLQTDR